MTQHPSFADVTPEALRELAEALGAPLLDVESSPMLDNARFGNDVAWLLLTYDRREEVLFSALFRARDGRHVGLTWLAKESGLTVEFPPEGIAERIAPLTPWLRGHLAPALAGDFQEFDELFQADLRFKEGAAFNTAVPLATPLDLDRAEELGADVARLLQPFAFLQSLGFRITAMRSEGRTLLVYLAGPHVDIEIRTGDAERSEKVDAQLVRHASGGRLSVSWLRSLETDWIATSEVPVGEMVERLQKESAIFRGDMRRFDEACAWRDRFGREHGMTFSA
jgi:hypothetical protein